MKIKQLLFLFLIVMSSAFAKEYQAIEKIDCFRFQVKEENFTGKKKKEIRYEILTELPKHFKKIVSYPKMNEGEIYLYSGEEKYVYLPIFKQTKNSKIDENENQVLKTIESLRQKLKTDSSFRKKYYNQEKLVLDLEQSYQVVLESYTFIDGYLFPNQWTLKEGDVKLMELSLTNIEIGPKFQEEDFKIP